MNSSRANNRVYVPVMSVMLTFGAAKPPGRQNPSPPDPAAGTKEGTSSPTLLPASVRRGLTRESWSI